eukprot:scaffold136597_cov31-Tisochrysis_lutea.AAC.9
MQVSGKLRATGALCSIRGCCRPFCKFRQVAPRPPLLRALSRLLRSRPMSRIASSPCPSPLMSSLALMELALLCLFPVTTHGVSHLLCGVA